MEWANFYEIYENEHGEKEYHLKYDYVLESE